MSNKQLQLDDLQRQIVKDKVCPELAEQATQLVFGTGNPEADIVFIGEAPGKNEDIKGEPFVGAAGKFLNEMLEMIGLKRADIYITNIVKYRPPNNRDPLPEEKSTFLPYLEQQIDIIDPKVIVTLGRHSMDVLLPSAPSCDSCKAGGPPEQCNALTNSEYRKDDVAKATSSVERSLLQSSVRSGGAFSEHIVRACSAPLIISQVHGQPKRIKMRSSLQVEDSSLENNHKNPNYQLPTTNYIQRLILPLFHPAAALYNGGLRQTLIDDFAKIPLLLDSLKASRTSVAFCRIEPTFSSLDVAPHYLSFRKSGLNNAKEAPEAQ